MAASGTVGTKRDLAVRLGATLTPQLITLQLGSGAILDPADGALIAFLYARESDTTPVAVDFDVAEVEPTIAGEPRYLIELSKEKVAELAALPVPAGARVALGLRTFWWTCFFEDAADTRRAVYFGKLTILLGATSG